MCEESLTLKLKVKFYVMYVMYVSLTEAKKKPVTQYQFLQIVSVIILSQHKKYSLRQVAININPSRKQSF